MQRDFNRWHNSKENLDNNQDLRVFFHEREVWWCRLGANIGFEQDGKGEDFARPILVFRKFNKEILWSLPLSTKIKSGIFYEPVALGDNIKRVAILSQLRLIDAKRLISKIGNISEENFYHIKKSVVNLCGLQPIPF